MTRSLLALLASALVVVGCSTGARVATPATDTAEAASDSSKFDKAVASSTAMEGLFTVYQDSTKGSIMLAIAPDQFDRDFIYFSHVVDGVPVGGHFRGQFRDNAVFTIRRRFDKVEFVAENTSFAFDDDNAVSRAAQANISPAVLAVEDVVAEEDGTVLIKADGLFLTEALAAIKPVARPGQSPLAFRLGNLSKEKTALVEIRNYPENTDAVVRYVYDNPTPLNGGGAAVTDARAVTVTVQHSLIAMPDNGYAALIDDPRVGYFTTQVTDLTSMSVTPYRDLVHRWHFEHADGRAAEPLVWWIENTTPVEYRDTIRDAALRWNEAFAAAGLDGAVEVRVQPDDADWDAGDMRYNVLRWTSSPTPPFGGYGPSFVNPRTGQILGADVMLEYTFIRNRMTYAELFETAGTYLDAADHAEGETDALCALGMRMQGQMLLGTATLRALGHSERDGETLVEQGLYYLVLHEIGHTLGLNHNMKSSQMLTFEQTTDWDLTMARGLTGSVMDYPAVNVAAPGESQGAYYTTRPGPYDVWAITFAYGDLSDAERAALLARSTEPALAFGNDADDMRSPGKAIDPRVNIGDMSSDALLYAERRLDLVEATFDGLRERYDEPGESYQDLLQAYFILTGEIGTQMAVASRYVGGVYVDRAMAGQPGATQPFTPVPAAEQRRAMALMARGLFAPDAFDGAEDVYAYLARQRRGFGFFSAPEDPRIHARALGLQRGVLAHLVHPNTVERITDARLYGNEYSLADMMADLTAALFDADARGDVNTFRQNVQIAYVTQLATMLADENNAYDAVAKSQVLAQLRRVEAMARARRTGNVETLAHRDHLLFLIERALDTD
ncbi:zinc-dependent metalloprotease [Rubrivirga sp. IMCC45206]|uniref:zinc-dependent metalloprotease n=1 Tax=Rubrivirga sp. IMCC45206 TaxID=3391614 RepID=UPI0039902E11